MVVFGNIFNAETGEMTWEPSERSNKATGTSVPQWVATAPVLYSLIQYLRGIGEVNE